MVYIRPERCPLHYLMLRLVLLAEVGGEAASTVELEVKRGVRKGVWVLVGVQVSMELLQRDLRQDQFRDPLRLLELGVYRFQRDMDARLCLRLGHVPLVNKDTL